MSVKFRTINRNILINGQKKPMVGALTVYRGETTLDRLCSLISRISAISEGDVKSILDTLSRLVADDLADGRRVDLGDLGRLRFTVRAKSVETADEFSTKLMRRPGIVFTPGKVIRSAMDRIGYQQEGSLSILKSEADKGDEGGEIEEPIGGNEDTGAGI